MADHESTPEAIDVSHTRRNGFSCPWHPLQLFAWFFILLIATFHYGFMVLYIPGNWRVFGYVGEKIPGLVFLVHVGTTIVTSSIDPAERNVRLKSQSQKRLRPRFDRSKHEHVIENYYCNLCCVAVTEKAKHCRLCDKCVTQFDHHCKWLNNCVGSRNYRWFLATIISALAGVVMALILSASLFILFFARRERLRYSCDLSNITACNETLRIFGAPIPDPVFPTLTAILGLLSLVGVLLIGHLTLFHMYLVSKGLTTYDHIQRKSVRESQSHERHCCANLFTKVNRVTPVEMEQCSDSSAGMANFDRTPSPSNVEACNEMGVAIQPDVAFAQSGSGAEPIPLVQPSENGCNSHGPPPPPTMAQVSRGQITDTGRGVVSCGKLAPLGHVSRSQVATVTGYEGNGSSVVDETGFTSAQLIVPSIEQVGVASVALPIPVEACLTLEGDGGGASVTALSVAPPPPPLSTISSPSPPEQR